MLPVALHQFYKFALLLMILAVHVEYQFHMPDVMLLSPELNG